jgi:hypothetical protein
LSVIHSFKVELDYSLDQSDETFWKTAYKLMFPTMVDWVDCSNNPEAQRVGIDRKIYLSNRMVRRIDEKKRRENYPDYLLEYISVDITNAPGWIEKDLAIDYIAYAFMPSKTVHFLPWDFLHRAWLREGERWKAKYRNVPGKNEGYTTWSVAVPIEEVTRAMICASMALVDKAV